MQGHNWETDPRPLAECLREWHIRLNGGREYGAREVGQQALRIASKRTYAHLMDGRSTPYEPMIRRLMTLIDAADAKKPAATPKDDGG